MGVERTTHQEAAAWLPKPGVRNVHGLRDLSGFVTQAGTSEPWAWGTGWFASHSDRRVSEQDLP